MTTASASATATATATATTPKKVDPLHGQTLEAIVLALAQNYGWDGLAERIPLRCFSVDPNLRSSLNFLRKTPWARTKVEGLYLFMLRDLARASKAPNSL